MQRLNRRAFVRLAALGSVAAAAHVAGCAPVLPQAEPTTVPAPRVEPTGTPPVLRQDTPTAPAATSTQSATPTVAAQPAQSATPNAAPSANTLAAEIEHAAVRALDTLDAGARRKASFAFEDKERFRWHWTTPGGFPRNGLPLKEMNGSQKAAALALLQASVSPAGYQKSLDIMSLQKDLGNDPELYYLSVFGTPGASAPWGWRFEGHHLSRNFTVVNGDVWTTPFFHGSWPTRNDAGLRAMPREEDAALELVNGLQGKARESAVFQERTLVNHVTSNNPRVSALPPVGIRFADLNDRQQGLALEILQAYLGSLSPAVGGPTFDRIRQSGLEEVRFGWAGSLEKRKPQYYRIQGATFLLEFDNSRNGGTHVHSVWRDFERDFGYHVL